MPENYTRFPWTLTTLVLLVFGAHCFGQGS